MIFESHPGRLLIDHLMDVREIGMGKVRNELQEAYNVVSITHDFGKYTEYFQEYLINKSKTDKSNHGFISAVFGAYIAMYRGMGGCTPLLMYSSIIHHHGNVKNITNNIANTFIDNGENKFDTKLDSKIEIANLQIASIKSNREIIRKDMKVMGIAEEFDKFLDEIDVVENILIKLKRSHYKIISKSKDTNSYFEHQEIYSALISSDKQSAAQIDTQDIIPIDFEEIDKIRSTKFDGVKTVTNTIRSNIYGEVQKTVVVQKTNNNIFTITAPTGTGKTITGFYAAAKLREELKLKGKIVYVIPFTSVIDQNYDVIHGILKETERFTGNESRYILKHHNLADKTYTDYDANRSELLVEDWQSDVIVTTFVQFLESIISNSNRMLKKYHNFRESVVLMDEIQSIDIKYYKLIEQVITKMCELYGMKVIMMTATKPLLLEEGTELLVSHEEYYKMFNRTKIEYYPQKITVDIFTHGFVNNIENKSYMVVANTINQSVDIYKNLKEIGRDIYYLSTNIIPKDRLHMINNIKEKLDLGEKPILVTTQMVEAGVDLDFEEVIRDIGPLDSVIQCAGRCNRENKKGYVGKVKVYNMVNDKDKLFGGYVYGATLISITQRILGEYVNIEEKNYLGMIQKYYEDVKSKKSQEESDEYLKSLEKMIFTDYDYSIDKFSLIKENPDYAQVIVVKDNYIEKTLAEYSKETDRDNRKRLSRVVKEYTLNIPLKNCVKLENYFGGSCKIVRQEVLEYYYDENTGFIREDGSSMVFM